MPEFSHYYPIDIAVMYLMMGTNTDLKAISRKVQRLTVLHVEQMSGNWLVKACVASRW